ncbi:NAD(P)H-binding protein [Actinoallomurus iriomotensis]|uniref:NmrA family transcriptional regulator n=1 Tax=Actinoallomurus iriomotensis TaxID=478107 RepID=A0A9W6RBP7_9ACTN|nr:NAD(P)H-binding protein [Actinoallomurus iriomotensis]GLY72919.1 NmrA family transcriptional regulator [Actinoallomurus iriomotensis]
MIVITTPAGNIGHRVLDRVLAGDQPVRVIVRDPAKLPADVRDRVEVIQGSHGDRRVVTRAFDGADAVFWLYPPDRGADDVVESYVGFTRPAAEAMRGQGVKRVVDVSSLGRGTAYAGRAGQATASLAMDDLIAGTGVAFRALALPGFMDNMLRQARALQEQGVFFGALAPDLKLPTVATRDIAAVAARLLLDTTWTGRQELPVLGPEDLSNNDMAAVISEVLGKPVWYEQVSAEALGKRLTGHSVSEAVARAILDMMTAVNNGLYDGVARTPQHAVDTRGAHPSCARLPSTGRLARHTR